MIKSRKLMNRTKFQLSMHTLGIGLVGLLVCLLMGQINLVTNFMIPNERSQVSPTISSIRIPIIIEGNAAFTSENGVLGGNGSYENPYFIQNWTIDSYNCSGIILNNTDAHVIISNCSVENELGDFCLYLQNTRNVLVVNNSFANKNYGIFMRNSVNNTIINNSIVNSTKNGIFLWNSTNSAIINNTVDNDYDAITISDSNNNTIIKNTINASVLGIALLNSNFTILENNILESGFFVLGASMNNTLTNNTIKTLQFRILESYNNTIGMSNTIKGKAIRYFENQKGIKLSGLQDVGQVILINCSDAIIEDLNFDGIYRSIEIIDSDNITLKNNSIQNGEIGIILERTNNSLFINNHFNMLTSGIYLHLSNNNKIVSNWLNENGFGILIGSSNQNVIDQNIIKFNHYGVSFWDSMSNNCTRNNISSNVILGLSIINSNQSIIWGNNFLNNTGNHTNEESVSTGNQFYYQQIGNYYDNYCTRYPTANNNGQVWNIPYDIDGDTPNSDLFPLVNPVVIEYPSQPNYFPNAPIFASITFQTGTGNLTVLSWSQVIGAVSYSIFRSNTMITTLSTLSPIATGITNTSYTDILPSYGTYYYVIIATNASGDSNISNCQSISYVALPTNLTTNTTNSTQSEETTSPSLPKKISGYPDILFIIGSIGGILFQIKRRNYKM